MPVLLKHKKHIIYTYIVFFFFFLPTIIVLSYHKIKERNLLKNPVYSTCKVLFIVNSPFAGTEKCNGNIIFEYYVNKIRMITCTDMPVKGDISYNSFDIPIYEGDEFMMVYDKNDIENYKVFFYKPTKKTLLKQLNRAEYFLKKGLEERNFKYPILGKNLKCIILKLFLLKGYDALADIYAYNVNILDNFKHNKYSFKKLIKSKEFKKIMNECNVY